MTNNVVSNVKAFIFGGDAEFTIRNTDSHNEYQYHVKVSKNNKNMFFVSVKQNHSFRYAGYMLNDRFGCRYNQGEKGFLDSSDAAIKGLFYAIKHGNEALPAPMELVHHGKCACCHRTLTDAESIRIGIGPVCRSYLGV